MSMIDCVSISEGSRGLGLVKYEKKIKEVRLVPLNILLLVNNRYTGKKGWGGRAKERKREREWREALTQSSLKEHVPAHLC